MSKKVLLEAVIHRLRSEMLENVAAMDNLLSQPTANTIDDFIECAMGAVQAEAAIHTVQQYFGGILSPPAQQPPPQPVQPPPPVNDEPLVVTPERSPTLRKSLAAAKKKKTSTKTKASTKKGE